VSAPWPRAEALTTQRLALEPLRPEHARELAPVLADPALHAFIGGEPATEDELRARFERQAAGRSPDGAQGWLNWVARDRATRAPVGTVQATITDGDGVRSAALAWVVATSRQGEGLATEAARAAVDWLRGRGVTRFVAHIPTITPRPPSPAAWGSSPPTRAMRVRCAGSGPRPYGASVRPWL
jgi:RimJ/RimL family protein N-acetyltransferase